MIAFITTHKLTTTPSGIQPDPCRLGGIAYQQAKRICSHRQDVADTKQDLLLAVLDRWPCYRPGLGSPDAFAGTVATNAAVSLLRHRRALKRNGGKSPAALAVAVDLADRQAAREIQVTKLRLDLVEYLRLLPNKLRDRCEQYLAFHYGGRSAPGSLEGCTAELRRYLEPLRPVGGRRHR